MSSKIYQNIHPLLDDPVFQVQTAGGDDCNSGVAAWECVLFFRLMVLDHMKSHAYLSECRTFRKLFLTGPKLTGPDTPSCVDG